MFGGEGNIGDAPGMNEEQRRLLRHFLAALAYRTQKALRGAPATFGDFTAGQGSRTPRELVRHMTSVLGYARTFFVGGVYRAEPVESLEAEVHRFHGVLADLAAQIETGSLAQLSPQQLLQGPLSDAMTHAGQLALLRRLSGSPVESENFIFAEVSADQLGALQPSPAAPTPAWLGRLVHAAWKLSRWSHRRRRQEGA
jgi:hypothetical protein